MKSAQGASLILVLPGIGVFCWFSCVSNNSCVQVPFCAKYMLCRNNGQRAKLMADDYSVDNVLQDMMPLLNNTTYVSK